MKKRLYILAIATLLSGSAIAQSGRIMGFSEFTFTDMLQLSQNNYSFGTARSAAMGGAFTSLGGDLSSISINPAGLGMYRSSEFGFSPSITINSLNSSYPQPSYQNEDSRTRFALNNFSVALNLYQGSGSTTSFTLGLGYNKVADFNSRSSIGFSNETYSIADIFAMQLNRIDVPAADLGSAANPFQNTGFYPNEWGAILGYQNRVIDPDTGAGVVNGYLVSPGMISPNALVNPYMFSENKGSIGEYSIAGGFNFNNKFYFGVAMGIQDIYSQQDLKYTETYSNNTADLDKMVYNQRTKIMGSAVNFKVGVVVRPTDGLRIGLAVHTPSLVSVDKQYSASMATTLVDGRRLITDTDLTVYNYDFASPTRLLTGISYTFGQWGVISADYERVWYNGMRLRNETNLEEAFKENMKYYCRGANNFRIGAEVKPLPMLALRAGYAYYGNVISDEANKDGENVFNTPIADHSYNISAGIGLRLNNFSIDMSYIYANSKYTQYDLFFDRDDAGNAIGQQGLISTVADRHIITLSMGLRF